MDKPDRLLKNVRLAGELTDIGIKNGKISFIGKSERPGEDMHGLCAYAGLIDIHSHGALGMSVNDGGCLEKLSDYQCTQGVTVWFPTTTTAPIDELASVTHENTDFSHGARIMGFHLEGPYINIKYKGAQDPANIKNPSLSEFSRFEHVKMMTLAPELPGSLEFIDRCGCRTIIGHSAADYDTALQAIRHGANCLTHTFNAMTPLHHRYPGIIGAAVEGDAYVQVICDGLHVHPAVVKLLYRTFGKKMIVISDSIKPAYLPDGQYFCDGHDTIVKDGVCTLPDGTVAGSSHSAFYGVQKLIEWGIPVQEAFYLASGAPAEYAGLTTKGKLLVGCDADIILVDDTMTLQQTIIEGVTEYVRGN